MKYLVKSRRGELPVQTDDLRVGHPQRHRVKRTRQSPIGPISELEHDGVDRSRLNVRAAGPDREVIRANGRPGSSNRYGATVPATAKGLKSAVRLLREQEADRIAEVDEVIEAIQDRLAAARRDREALVAEAWSRGNVVRLADLQDEIASHPRGIL